MDHKSKNITRHDGDVKKEHREELNKHKGACLWFTGLSGSGKSTVAVELQNQLFSMGARCYPLDGDNMRFGLNKDLGFSPEDRQENIRRIGEVAKLFTDAGTLVTASFISPYRADRDKVRELMGDGDFVEIHVSTDLSVCEDRDPKGLYKKARSGEIPNFTGISAPYEAPEKPEMVLDTGEGTPADAAAKVVDYLKANGYLSL
ncbi:MAG: adenylyl-sulfate kinase [Calditrichia bacterium]